MPPELENQQPQNHTAAAGDPPQPTPPAGDPAANPPSTDPAGTTDTGNEPAGAPEAYETFTLPEGIQIDETRNTEFGGLMREMNATQEQAQKLVDYSTSMQAQAVEAQAEQYATLVKDWGEQARADDDLSKDFDGHVAHAARALDRFGTKELRGALDQFGWGNHPELIRFMSRIGKALGEDTGAPPQTGGDGVTKDAAAILYGSSP